MNASPSLQPGSAHPDLHSHPVRNLDNSTSSLPVFIASNWLTYSLANLVTGPILSTYAGYSESDHTIANSLANRFAKTLEVKLTHKISQPISQSLLNDSTTTPIALESNNSIASLGQNFALFHSLQFAELSTKTRLFNDIIPKQVFPKSYLLRVKTNLEFDVADQDAVALDNALSRMVNAGWNALYSIFQPSQEAPTELPPTETGTSQPDASQPLSLSSCIRDYVVFSVFYLLKIITTQSNHLQTPLHPYVELLSDEGMVISSDRMASVIVDYLIEKREMALDAIFIDNPFLEKTQNIAQIFINNLHESLPEGIQELLNLAAPSEDFYSKHCVADIFKDLLTSMAVAIPATGAGIHLLPRVFDSKGLAFAIVMETSTNVMIHLAGRAALPLSDFMSEKSLSAMKGLHFMLASPLADDGMLPDDQELPSAMAAVPTDVLSPGFCAAPDAGVIMNAWFGLNARNESVSTIYDAQVLNSGLPAECLAPSFMSTATLIGVAAPNCLAHAI